MKLKTVAFMALAILAISSCNKKNTPSKKKDYLFTYNVRVSNKITEPTIISGFHGTVMKYEGDFMPKMDATGADVTNKPEVVRNEILIYTADLKGKLDSATYTDDGVTFYSLKKLKKAKVKPKYIIRPNKSGFYQIDLGTGEYLALIKINKKKAYFNGGVRTLQGTSDKLTKLEMRIDYKATF